jgi:hypothetical protein
MNRFATAGWKPPARNAVPPLAIAQLRQQVAGPGDIIRPDAIAHILFVPAVIGEVDVSVVHPENERVTLEPFDMAFP